MTAGEALRHAASALRQAGIESANLEARLLLAHALGVDRSVLIDRRREIDAASFHALLHRRLEHEPLALITGRQGFWTLDLAVSRDTLIPRADSETLITAAVDALAQRPPRRILDLGTGTGCLLLAALVEFPEAFGVGVDLSPQAAALARRNAADNGLADQSAFLAGDWARAIAGRFDLVLSNPPYIPRREIATLMPEVALHEPVRALDGGEDGLDAYRAILTILPDLLTADGVAILELGAGQADLVASMAARSGLEKAALCHDLGGVGRALVLVMQKTFGNVAEHG
jgi:release factor glutamine methyltransferase